MPPERRYLWIAVAVVAAAIAAVLLVPRVREELSPQPQRALVAVSTTDSPLARVGRVELVAGEDFTLYAVLVALGRDGEPFYYTEAEQLEVDGARVPPDRVRLWDRDGHVAVLWFTLEGYRPFVELETTEQLDGYRYEAAFRPQWGRGWTIAGSVTPSNHSLARGADPETELRFGTARYHVRIERYLHRGDPAPVARYSSPGPESVLEGSPQPTLVVRSLAGGLARPSAAFGLPHLEPGATLPRPAARRLADWYRRDIAFSRLLVLGRMLADRGLVWSDLRWEPIDLAERPSFEPAGVGDLLRSGGRTVVIYRDRGETGRLDYDDLCFDFVENAAIRPLREVFVGGGVLEWADLEAISGKAVGERMGR